MIYVLDSDDAYIEGLEKAGIEVEKGSLGYSLDSPLCVSIDKPPHEADAFVYNLTKPACYDRDNWGPGGNSNRKCTVVKKIDSSKLYYRTRASGPTEERARYQLVHGAQIKNIMQDSPFSVSDILKAIAQGGVPLIVFLNSEHVEHAEYDFIDWLDIELSCSITTANQISIPEVVRNNYPLLEAMSTGQLEFEMPLRVKCSTIKPKYSTPALGTPVTVVANRVNDILCQFVTAERAEGAVLLAMSSIVMAWLAPEKLSSVLSVPPPPESPLLLPPPHPAVLMKNRIRANNDNLFFMIPPLVSMIRI